MRRAEVRERGEQVLVGPDVISRHLSVGDDGNEDIHNVVGERPAIVGVASWPLGIIKEDVRQQSPGYPRCLLRRIPTRVLQRVREDGDETSIVRRLRSELGAFLRSGEEYQLRGPS